MYVYSGGYGLIGTYEEMLRELEGIARSEYGPGDHLIQKPMAFCLSRSDIDRLVSAFRVRADYMGWVINAVEVRECSLGDPPGFQAILDFTVPVKYLAAPMVRGTLPRVGDRPVDTPTVVEDEGGALVEVSEKKTPTWVWVAGGLAGVAVIGGIIYAVTR